MAVVTTLQGQTADIAVRVGAPAELPRKVNATFASFFHLHLGVNRRIYQNSGQRGYMNNRPSWSRVVLAFATALVTGALLGSVVQTQINLLALAGLGVDIGAGAWLGTTLEDLLKFGPVYLVMFGFGFLVSQLTAMAVTRYVLQSWRRPVCALASAVGLWATFRLVDTLAPPPTLIAATRDADGMLAMLVTAAVAGWLFARMAGSRSPNPVRPAADRSPRRCWLRPWPPFRLKTFVPSPPMPIN